MKRVFDLAVVMILLSIGLVNFVSANDKLKPFIPLKTDTPPVIDGVLDDQVWKEAPFETGFKTWYPDFGIDMVENTRVWYAYDQENLYFAFRCYDSQPDRIKASVTSRDKIRPDDWICINLDTFNDQQGLYAFYTNPRGIQMDSRAIGDNEDPSIDFIWFSEGRIDDEGYTIELKIPFKSIRFSHKDPVEMGVIFERRISRTSEMGTYPPLDPKIGPNFYIQTRTLVYKDIKHYRLFEVLPAVTYGRNSSTSATNTDKEKLYSEGDKKDLSLTSKFGITSHLVLDGTFNPDFSQVEADASQADYNERFDLFFPEKRPFFLEGNDSFSFGGSSGGDPLGAVVHTRMIVNPIVGVKLTGKIGQKNTIASIYALDELPNYLEEGDYANFAILRYKRSLSKDNFSGAFYTGRELEDGYNRVIGADGQTRVTGSSRLGYHAFLSSNKDTSKTNGHAIGINYYLNSRDWLMNVRLHDISENFQTQTGYVTRTNVTRIRAGVIRMFYPDSKIIRRIDPLFNNQFIRDKASEQWENFNAFFLSFILPRSSYARIGYGYSTEIFLGEKFNTSSFSIIGRSQLTKQFYFDLSYKYGKKIRYVTDPYQGKGSNVSASLIYQPSSQLYSSLSLVFRDFYTDSTGVKEFDYNIIRSKNTFQFNKYLFFRAIVEYHSLQKELRTDFLASFTYIPGTVIHLGYGSIYDKKKWQNDDYVDSDRFIETNRVFFFKTSYLWRL